MIEWFMFGALGFFLGCLLALMLAPPLWNRAVKLTTRRLEATMPMSLADIQADKDQLRAEYAIELRKVEGALDKSKEKAARELIEANKRRVEIQGLNNDLGGIKSQLQEAQNANRVLQQTIKRRLPDLDSRLKAAKKALAELETVNAELRNTVASQSEALKIARGTVHNQRADIDRLRMALESGSAASGRGSSKSDARTLAETQRLAAELSRTQEELDRAKTSAQESAFLRRELSRLASQILTASRNQAMQPQPVAADMHPHYPEVEITAEVMEQEAAWHEAREGNGAAPDEMEEADMEMEAAAVETVEMEYAEGEYPEEPAAVPAEEEYAEDYAEGTAAPEDGPNGAEAPKSTLAQRFAARRAKRQADKSGGGSLTSRLRGLVAESSETRT
jgi:chromosome segregation ATPase